MPEMTIAQAMEIAMQAHREGRLEEAESIYRQVLALDGLNADATHLLGVIALQRGQKAVGKALVEKALTIAPNYAGAHNSLGHALSDEGKWDEAVAAYQKAIELNPRMDEAHNNMGIALKDAGRLTESIAAHRHAVEINPANSTSHGNLIYTLYFHPGYDARAIYEEHAAWERQHAAGLASGVMPHANDRTPGRRLRVGYVSPNFREHVVGRFMLPLVREHDRQAVEVFCYSLSPVSDGVTAEFRRLTDQWRIVANLSDEQIAEAVRRDQIDVLVDLTMHMKSNRLLVFARHPAPVQVTYLAYCGTTGLSAIDYRLSDGWIDPVGMDETVYSEKTVRLESYWCYEPSDKAGEVSALPAAENGYVTFGCLNNFCKVTDGTLEAWWEIMRVVAGSRLLLHSTAGAHRQRVIEILGRYGVGAERVEFVPLVEMQAYFSLYQRMDVALDPFPYAGGTTTCDALWMGVPVVTLAGQTAVGRGGVSILSNVGCPELIAKTRAEYVRIAVELAADLVRLRKHRASLREKMRGSVLMDAPRFARSVEAAYRTMWRQWCGKA